MKPCDAQIHVRGTYRPRRIAMSTQRQCKRNAAQKVGHLQLCSQHAKMAREGLIDSDAHVAPEQSIADVRRYPAKFPHGLYDWLPTVGTPKARPVHKVVNFIGGLGRTACGMYSDSVAAYWSEVTCTACKGKKR